MFILWKFKKSIFSKKIQKSLCITTKSLYTNSNYLKNYNDSEHAVKTKNAPFFMIFPTISFFHMIVPYWNGPLSLGLVLISHIEKRFSHFFQWVTMVVFSLIGQCSCWRWIDGIYLEDWSYSRPWIDRNFLT